MSSLDALTVSSIAESSRTAARLAGMGEFEAAKSALGRARERLELFERGKASHSRNVRVAREAFEKARAAVEAARTATPRIAAASVRSAERSAERAKA